MSLAEIRDNMYSLDKKTKEEVIQYVHELMIHEKRQDSKIVSLKTEIKYLTRNLTKIRNMIDKTLSANKTQVNTWKETIIK